MTDIIKAYDHNYNDDHKKISDFIRNEYKAYSANVLEPALLDNLFKHALQMTAYERNGAIYETDLYQYLASETELNDKVAAYNAWALENENELIYSMDEFNDVMNGLKPEQIADMVYFGNYNPRAEWFTFDGYGNIKTLWDYDDLAQWGLDEDELKEYFIVNNNFEYFTDEDVSMIRETLKYKNIIIDTALYMVSLGY